MAMYDMICNPDVSLKDIEYRQCLLGGNYLGCRPENETAGWKTPYYNEKADMAEKFYRYVQEEASSGRDMQNILWSVFLPSHSCRFSQTFFISSSYSAQTHPPTRHSTHC